VRITALRVSKIGIGHAWGVGIEIGIATRTGRRSGSGIIGRRIGVGLT
jgi:hypothetical protein